MRSAGGAGAEGACDAEGARDASGAGALDTGEDAEDALGAEDVADARGAVGAKGVRDEEDAVGAVGAGGAGSAADADDAVGAGAASAFDPVAYINEPRWQASRLGLERIRALLDRLGRPQDDLRFVHVAGTNGKGSVCTYLASVLQAAGYRTGLFTSPFILRFEERIRVDGADISRDDLARATLLVREQAEALAAETGDHPTEFELMCAVALVHFRAAGCDLVVLEVGLGGRLDSTNVIDAPEACVITRIGLDHTALLGDTLAAVAGEKCGILKPGVPVASWPQEPEALEVVRAACAAQGCELVIPNFESLQMEPLKLHLAPTAGEHPADDAASQLEERIAEGVERSCGGSVLAASASQNVSRETFVREFSYGGADYRTALLGSYQPANAALAIEAVGLLRGRGWRISDEAVREGIAAARWPGRFEVVAARPLTVVDGGHNPQGAQALADSLADLLGALDPVSDLEPGPLGPVPVPDSLEPPQLAPELHDSAPDTLAPLDPASSPPKAALDSSELLEPAPGPASSPAFNPMDSVSGPFEAAFDPMNPPLGSTGSVANPLEAIEVDREDHQKVIMVMGVLADKDYPAMVEAVVPLADAFVCYAPDNPRALAAADLAATVRAAASGQPVSAGPSSARIDSAQPASAGSDPARDEDASDPLAGSSAPHGDDALGSSASPGLIHVETAPDAAAALRRGRELAGPGGVVVAFGSLYAIADLKRAL